MLKQSVASESWLQCRSISAPFKTNRAWQSRYGAAEPSRWPVDGCVPFPWRFNLGRRIWPQLGVADIRRLICPSDLQTTSALKYAAPFRRGCLEQQLPSARPAFHEFVYLVPPNRELPSNKLWPRYASRLYQSWMRYGQNIGFSSTLTLGSRSWGDSLHSVRRKREPVQHCHLPPRTNCWGDSSRVPGSHVRAPPSRQSPTIAVSRTQQLSLGTL